MCCCLQAEHKRRQAWRGYPHWYAWACGPELLSQIPGLICKGHSFGQPGCSPAPVHWDVAIKSSPESTSWHVSMTALSKGVETYERWNPCPNLKC